MKLFRIGVAGLVLVCALTFAVPALAKVIKGTREDDRLIGGRTGDTILGKRGNDVLRGGRGGDLIIGSAGNDRIRGGKGFDEMRGGKGNDRIRARDGKPDQIDCGPGEDTVLVDAVEDGVFGCERVKVAEE